MKLKTEEGHSKGENPKENNYITPKEGGLAEKRKKKQE